MKYIYYTYMCTQGYNRTKQCLVTFWGFLCEAEAVNVEVVTEIQYLTVKAAGGKGCEGYGGA